VAAAGGVEEGSATSSKLARREGRGVGLTRVLEGGEAMGWKDWDGWERLITES